MSSHSDNMPFYDNEGESNVFYYILFFAVAAAIALMSAFASCTDTKDYPPAERDTVFIKVSK